MSLLFTTWAELKTSIAEVLNRTDLTTAIPGFIALAEAQMTRRIRTRRMVERDTATLTSQYIALPDNFGGPRSMVLSGTSPKVALQYVSPETALELQQSTYSAAGQPVCYSVVGEEFQFLPSPDASYTLELTYWKRIEVLSGSNTSNWVLEDHPDAYLYGSLVQSAPYLKDDGRLAMWGTLFEAALADINREEAMADYAGRLNRRAARVF